MLREAQLIPLVKTIQAVCRAHGKDYCYPSQRKLLELLERYHNISISERTLNRWLARLEAGGYLERRRRISKARGGGLRILSTLYILKAKAYRALARMVRALSSWKIRTATAREAVIRAPRGPVRVACAPGGCLKRI